MQEQQVNFGSFVFSRASGTLRQAGTIVPLGGRAAALLDALLEADGSVVTKAALMELVWRDTFVEDGNLTAQIAILRRILGPRPDGRDWIDTVSRVGYRLARDAAEPDAAEVSGKPLIAVLPFVNLSSDAEQDYFVDGMVDDLITALSRFKSFAVVARNSSFVYKNRAVDVREVARALGVRYLLEGSVRRAKRQVRVSAQLIEGAGGAHLWAENFDGVFEDVFDFQDRITETVVGLVEPQVRQAEIVRARRRRPENLDAYDLYLQALPLVHQGQNVLRRLEHYNEAVELFERAVALDPTFAPALAYAAWAHEKRLTRGGVAPPGVDDAQATLALAERALAADSDDAIVLVIAGVSLITVKNDAEGGFALIRRALSLNPNSQLVAGVAGYAHFHCGSFEESIKSYLRAARLSPGVPEGFAVLGCIARSHLAMGRIEEALGWGLRSLEGYAGYDFAHCVTAASYAHLGRVGEARATAQRALAIWPALTIASLLGSIAQPEGRDRLLIDGLLKAGMPAS